MYIKKKKFVTNSTRHQINIQKNLLSKSNKFIKIINKGYNFSSGRSKGRITCRHKGGIRKNVYRIIKNNSNIGLKIITIYDPFRNTFLNINYDIENNNFFHSISVDGIYPGSWIINQDKLSSFRTGYKCQIKNIFPGAIISDISEKTTLKSKYIKSAGCYGQLIRSNSNIVKIKLPSSKVIELKGTFYCQLGIISNKKKKLTILGKAGRNRLKGKRPSVRGVAMNPVDHPHGGRTNGGKPSVTPWGLPTKCGFKLKKK